jgi:hypothetical protein
VGGSLGPVLDARSKMSFVVRALGAFEGTIAHPNGEAILQPLLLEAVRAATARYSGPPSPSTGRRRRSHRRRRASSRGDCKSSAPWERSRSRRPRSRPRITRSSSPSRPRPPSPRAWPHAPPLRRPRPRPRTPPGDGEVGASVLVQWSDGKRYPRRHPREPQRPAPRRLPERRHAVGPRAVRVARLTDPLRTASVSSVTTRSSRSAATARGARDRARRPRGARLARRARAPRRAGAATPRRRPAVAGCRRISTDTPLSSALVRNGSPRHVVGAVVERFERCSQPALIFCASDGLKSDPKPWSGAPLCSHS